MSTISRYVLVDKDDQESDHEYESYIDAENDAAFRGAAVIERTYEYSGSELVWTPDGSSVWPPSTDRIGLSDSGAAAGVRTERC